MGVPEKLARQAASQLGSDVIAASMVVPPGATLYGSFAPSARVTGIGGPIADALASQLDESGAGVAATVPRQMGVLAVTDDELVFCKKRLLGVGCRQKLVSWPRRNVSAMFDQPDRWAYPGVLLRFGDGTTCVVYGEKRWGLDALAAALNS